MEQSIADALPQSYRPFLPEFFGFGIRAETRAVCDDCSMCSTTGTAAAPETCDGLFFRPDAKCCTYYPSLPNFSVGALLASSDPQFAEGRRRVRATIAARVGVHPSGLLAPAEFVSHFNASPELFGRDISMLCPYFGKENGGCTIWPFREAVAVTFFCKHNHGESGRNFWMALKAYLRSLEDSLIRHSLRALGFSGNALERNHDQPCVPPAPEERARLWGSWAGREEALYVKCHELVRKLSYEDVTALGGADHEVKLEEVRRRYREMVAPELPATLRVNPELEAERMPDGSVLLLAYSAYDPLRIGSPLYDAIRSFDGRRPNRAVLAEIESKQRLRLSPNLLTKLFQFGVLVEAAG